MTDINNFKSGWLKDPEDNRDFLFMAKPEVVQVLPPSMDLRASDTRIENQGAYGSCAAHAGTGEFEYLENKVTKTYTERSRMFLYKEARDLDGSTGDVGTYLRSVAKVMADMGLPPESIWPYTSSNLNAEPTTAVKNEAIKAHADSYWRLDGGTHDQTILNIKAAIANNGLPVMFGCTVYSSIFNTGSDGMIPAPGGSVAGGHAMLIVGYDDAKQRFLIKNSWGTSWGASGYGWLSYSYDISNAWIIAKESQIIDTILTPTTITLSV